MFLNADVLKSQCILHTLPFACCSRCVALLKFRNKCEHSCRSVLPFLTVLFGAANSHTQARDALAPYLEMKGVKDPAEQDALVVKHKLMFYQFGWAALILSCIPVVGAFFAFTNTVGAALWAIDLEKQHFDLMSDDRKKIS